MASAVKIIYEKFLKLIMKGVELLERILHMFPVVIICSFILIIFPEKSYACDCIKVSTEDAFQNDVVFEGKVIEVVRKAGLELKCYLK